ncbi:insulin-like growth factor isoform X1 [Danaus plexippus]|uniref:insulin-like growth factor isoform X1 n=1 Tax=Danaus plexippus TaxID=13037 RepID=UPI002AB15CA0|nr:insulin-like growth factor isoform X1 [Danaus plexippus]
MNMKTLLTLFGMAVLWDWRCDAATVAVKLCGRQLGDMMSKVCHVYNSPPGDVPTVVEQPHPLVRRRRRTGIADECCIYGCTWEQLSSYCAISAKSESPLDSLEAHMIADRSAEVASKSSAAKDTREVGRRSRGYGRGRCWCRRRSSRRPFMGNTERIRNAARAAPVLGTVSPLLTWGRTLNTDFPTLERNRYAYISVYS